MLILILSLGLNPFRMIFKILWIAFFVSVTVQFIYLLFIYGRLAFYKQSPSTAKNMAEEGVSIVVAARNECENLKTLIPALVHQDYPEYEIIIVNDRSSDGSMEYLDKARAEYQQVSVIHISNTPAHVNPKKYALAMGIKRAKFEIILLTDADCWPVSGKWVHLMSCPLRSDQGKTFSLGYGAYQVIPGFLNRLIQYETLFTAMNYFGFAIWKCPVMGVGRNLCYRKNFFLDIKGFKGFWHIQGGDDDLIINQYANGNNTAVVIDPKARTVSHPQTAFKNYLMQKKRHFHAGKYYRLQNKLKLGLYMFTHLVFWVSGLLLIFQANGWEPITTVLGLIFSRALVQLTVFCAAKKKLEGSGNVYWTMFFDLMYLSYFWVIGPKGYLSTKIKWK